MIFVIAYTITEAANSLSYGQIV